VNRFREHFPRSTLTLADGAISLATYESHQVAALASAVKRPNDEPALERKPEVGVLISHFPVLGPYLK